jgi:5-oxoprolinase (ATP-hydrolysing) subunit B
MKLLPYGDRAVLVETAAGEPGPLALCAAAADVAGVLEAVPAARAALIGFDPAETGADAIRAALSTAIGDAAPGHDGEPLVITVRYDGPDLAAVAEDVGMDVDEVVRRHVAGEYTVAFCGFAPGFAYLSGLDERLQLGRLPEPRTSVPAGAVGVAGEFTGVYPRSSPGGWRLLGSTDAALWDSARTPPALLVPGARVRFAAA